MDFRQRLGQGKTQLVNDDIQNAVETHVASMYFATDKTKSPACLELRFPDGTRKALPYSYITELNYDIDKGIEIIASNKRITITGRNIAPLFDYLVTYRVRYIKAHNGNDVDEDGLFVQEISIEEITL